MYTIYSLYNIHIFNTSIVQYLTPSQVPTVRQVKSTEQWNFYFWIKKIYTYTYLILVNAEIQFKCVDCWFENQPGTTGIAPFLLSQYLSYSRSRFRWLSLSLSLVFAVLFTIHISIFIMMLNWNRACRCCKLFNRIAAKHATNVIKFMLNSDPYFMKNKTK